jgi:translation initiation factor 2 beta subunit (eIF-2beta)/eIF-5
MFDNIGGYNESFVIYEDNEIIKRLYQQKQFCVIPKSSVTSARRYRINSVCKLQYHFSVIHLKRKLGYSPEHMLDYYKKNVK